MKLPRNISGQDLCKALKFYGYSITRQKGSHIRLTTNIPSQHHITIPDHNPIKIGTLSSILETISAQVGLSKEELIKKLFY
jgi:predicted RNA binding protein YcfA (HicA-like mRNA interferase family)